MKSALGSSSSLRRRRRLQKSPDCRGRRGRGRGDTGRQERRPIAVLIPSPFSPPQGQQPDYPFLSGQGQRLQTLPSHIIIFERFMRMRGLNVFAGSDQPSHHQRNTSLGIWCSISTISVDPRPIGFCGEPPCTASSCLISFPIHPGATACAGNWSLPVNLGAATFPHYDRHEHIICFVQ